MSTQPVAAAPPPDYYQIPDEAFASHKDIFNTALRTLPLLLPQSGPPTLKRLTLNYLFEKALRGEAPAIQRLFQELFPKMEFSTVPDRGPQEMYRLALDNGYYPLGNLLQQTKPTPVTVLIELLQTAIIGGDAQAVQTILNLPQTKEFIRQNTEIFMGIPICLAIQLNQSESLSLLLDAGKLHGLAPPYREIQQSVEGITKLDPQTLARSLGPHRCLNSFRVLFSSEYFLSNRPEAQRLFTQCVKNAIVHRNFAILEVLLQSPLARQLPEQLGNMSLGYALCAAAYRSRTSCMKVILSLPAAANIPKTAIDNREYDHSMDRAIFLAAANGHLQSLKTLLASEHAAGFPPNSQWISWTADFTASSDCLKAFLESRASENISAEDLGLAVWDTAYHNNVEGLNTLLASKRFTDLPANADFGRCGLWHAIYAACDKIHCLNALLVALERSPHVSFMNLHLFFASICAFVACFGFFFGKPLYPTLKCFITLLSFILKRCYSHSLMRSSKK